MNKNFRIKSQKQRRAVIALLERESIEVKDLGVLIGALNPRQIVFELRQQGFEDVIKTQFFERIDRDGNRCRPGRYFIPSTCKPRVWEFLKKDGCQAVHEKTKPQVINQGSINHNKEGE